MNLRFKPLALFLSIFAISFIYVQMSEAVEPARALPTTDPASVSPPTARTESASLPRNEPKTRAEFAKQKAVIEAQRKTSDETLKNQLEGLADAKKKAAVTSLNTRLSELNKKRTDEMTQDIAFLTAIHQKLSTRMTELNGKGVDISQASPLKETASSLLTQAQADVDAQALKLYTLSFATEATLRANVTTQIQTLQTDLRTTRASILKAKDAVSLFAHALSDKPGTKPSPTTSGVQRPTPIQTLRL